MSHSHAIASTPFLDKPICYPVKLVLKPFQYVMLKVNQFFHIVLGYFSRIGVFPFGEWCRCPVKRKIIEFSKGGCLDTANRTGFDYGRVNRAFTIIKKMGGVHFDTISKDGTKLDSMMIRFRDVKKVIEDNGGKFVHCYPINDVNVTKDKTKCREATTTNRNEYVDIIVPDKQEDLSKWKEFATGKNGILNHVGLEVIEIQQHDGTLLKGFITKHWNEQTPKRPKKNLCFLRCNSPSESFAFAKRDIFRHVLGLQADMFCFDPRGTWHSKGIPTVGGYYLDAQAAFEKLVHNFGYDPTKIWATGFCLGAASAVHLKEKFHETGINLCTQNGFNSMYNTYKQQVFPAPHLGRFGLSELQSRDPKICSLVEQDYFNNHAKLEKIAEKGKHGASFIINTATDTTIDPDSYVDLHHAASKVSTHIGGIFLQPNSDKNGHSHDVLKANGNFHDRHVFDHFTRFLAKIHPEESQPWYQSIPYVGPKIAEYMSNESAS